MSRPENITNSIWDDPEFAELSPNATLLYIWSWTNPRCGMAGVYKVGHRAMLESKVPEASLPDALEELARTRFAFYEDSILFVRSRVKHLRARSPKMAISVARDVGRVPADHPLRERFLQEYGSWSWLETELSRLSANGSETVSQNPIGKPDSHTVSGPSRDGPRTGTGTGSSSKADELPEDFPRDLEPHLDAVHRTLSALAVRHQANAVSRLSLASVLMARPRKPLVRAAYDFAAWADSKGQRRKDVVAGYRNWLGREDDLAATERLPGAGDGDGAPVVPLRRSEALRQADGFLDSPEYAKERGA